MKSLLYSLIVFCSINATAVDMSKTEDPRTAYKENPDGTSKYIGKCKLHENYEKINFKISKTIIPYTTNTNEIESVLKQFDRKLVKSVIDLAGIEDASMMDDLTIEKLSMRNNSKLDLVRLNIGVGGGNGMYLVFAKIKGEDVLLTQTMDGDVQFCDSLVWSK